MAGKGKPDCDSPVKGGIFEPTREELSLPINHYPEINKMVKPGGKASVDGPAPEKPYHH